MAGVDPKILANSLNRARDLINDSNFNQIVEKNSKKVEFSDTPYVMDSSDITNNKKVSYNQNNLTEENFKTSKLPKEILDEIQKNPLNVNNGMSFIDELIEPLEIKKVPQRNNTINNNSTSVGIDYTIIKAIVDESVKRNLTELFGNIINESKNNNYIQLLRIGKGNKIQVLDNKGNLYESVLSLKKNINK